MVALAVPAPGEIRAHRDRKDQQGLEARLVYLGHLDPTDNLVHLDHREPLAKMVSQDLAVTKATRVRQGRWDLKVLRDLVETPAHLAQWVQEDLLEKEARLDPRDLPEHQVRLVKWDLKDLQDKLDLQVKLGLQAVEATLVSKAP
jgi:hypothetical protein